MRSGLRGRRARSGASHAALGYQAVEATETTHAAPSPSPAPIAAEPPPELQGVLAALERVTDALADERRQLMAAAEDRGRVEREREDARIEAARLEAQLTAERDRRQELEQRLVEVECRRARWRWWRR